MVFGRSLLLRGTADAGVSEYTENFTEYTADFTEACPFTEKRASAETESKTDRNLP